MDHYNLLKVYRRKSEYWDPDKYLIVNMCWPRRSAYDKGLFISVGMGHPAISWMAAPGWPRNVEEEINGCN